MDRSARVVSPREQLLTRYFRRPPVRPSDLEGRRWITFGGALALAGILLLVVSSRVPGAGFLSFVLLLGAGSLVFHGTKRLLQQKYHYEKALVATFPQPPDREVDQWFDEALGDLRKHSLEKLELTEDDIDEVVELRPIIAPVLWAIGGVPRENLVSKNGLDGLARYGVYRISCLWLTRDALAIFCCDYNFIRNAVLNEETHEFYYQDIVSVSTREEASSLTLASGSSLTSVQEFRISVANDRYFTMTIGSEQLKQLTGAERIPDNGTEQVIRALRSKLKEKKQIPSGL